MPLSPAASSSTAPAEPSPRPPAPGWLLALACGAAYGLFWLVGRPLLPARVQADRLAGLLPALVIGAAALSVLRRQPRAALLTFGATLAALLVYVGLMRIIY